MKTIYYSLPRLYAWFACLMIGFALQARGQENVVVSGTTIEITISQAGEFYSNYDDADAWQAICPSNIVRLKVKGNFNRNDFDCIKGKLSETLGELDLAEATPYNFSWTTHEFAKFESVVDHGNPYLRYISLPNSMQSLTDYFFLKCSKLEEVKIPEGLRQIGLSAFWGCSSLSTLTLPESLIHIYPYFGDTGLTEVHLRGAIVPYEFEPRDAENITLYVPVGYLSVFQESAFGNGWKEIKEETATLANLADADWAALQQLYASTQGATWTRSWKMGDTKEDTHPLLGAIIEDDHLVGLNLPDNNLVGQLPASIFTLSALKSINLPGNQLTGNLTTIFADIPINNTVKALNLERNQLKGDISAVITKLSALTDLNASYNSIGYCSALPPSTLTKLALKGQELTEYMLDSEGQPISYSTIFNLSYQDEDAQELLPSLMLLTKDGNSYRYLTEPYIGLCDDWDDTTWKVQLRWRVSGHHYSEIMSFDSGCDGWYRGAANAPVQGFVRDHLGNGSYYSYLTDSHLFKVTLDFQPGDANFDTKVNLSDMQIILRTALNASYRRQYEPLNFTAANLVATDDYLNVLDVVACINLMLDQGLTPSFARTQQPVKAQSQDDNAEATLGIDAQGQLVLNSTVPVAALELQLTDGDAEWTQAMNPFSHASREGHHIFYSLFNDELPTGATVIATTSAGLRAAMAVDKDGHRISLNFTQGVTDGIDKISNRSFVHSTQYYDLQGRQFVKRPLHSGVYIQDGKKIVVK